MARAAKEVIHSGSWVLAREDQQWGTREETVSVVKVRNDRQLEPEILLRKEQKGVVFLQHCKDTLLGNELNIGRRWAKERRVKGKAKLCLYSQAAR